MLAIDLFCGLGGWTQGFLAEGFDVIGFDIERHNYGTGGYPGWMVLQDVRTLHRSQFKDAAVIVASPPCQKYSYMAMPWKRAKALAAWYRESAERIAELNALFDACFRIQREASKAAGRHIPLIVENVKGAQPWVGRAQWHFGSFYLWGDIPALMPIPSMAQKFNPDMTGHPPGSWFAIADSKNRGAKTEGQNWSRFNKTGEVSPHFRMEGLKLQTSLHIRDGEAHGELLGKNTLGRKHGSKSKGRKAASAAIAKIPFPLARHIARCFKRSGGE